MPLFDPQIFDANIFDHAPVSVGELKGRPVDQPRKIPQTLLDLTCAYLEHVVNG